MTKKKSHQRGFIFGFSQAIQFVAWGVTLWFGGWLVERNEIEFTDVFTVQNAIIGMGSPSVRAVTILNCRWGGNGRLLIRLRG